VRRAEYEEEEEVLLMILFVASVLFLKVLCLIDGDAKDEEDARSTKDILFDDVLCVLCYPPTCLSCEENDSSIRFSRDGKPYDSTTYFARVRSIFSLLLLLLLLLLLCWCCCCCHRGYQTWLYYSSFPSPSGIKRNFSNASRNSLEVGTPCPPSCSNTTDFSLL